MKIKTKIIILMISTVILLLLIFKFSSADTYKSNGTSKKLIYQTTIICEKVFLNHDIDNNKLVKNLNYPIRKLAHFSLYFMLGILIYLLLKYCKIKHIKIITIIASLIYAILDELHQTSVLGRTGQIKDVFIDLSGSILAVFVLKKYLKNK